MNLNTASSFKIIIQTFASGTPIPLKYTPYGIDVNPEIIIEGEVPEKTKSFALILVDPDAPKGNWYHWMVKDIPVNTKTIPENSVPGVAVTNSWGIKKYKGPKPPSGTHRYFFKMFALDVNTFKAEDPNQFIKQVNEHLLEEASFMGTFQHKGK